MVFMGYMCYGLKGDAAGFCLPAGAAATNGLVRKSGENKGAAHTESAKKSIYTLADAIYALLSKLDRITITMCSMMFSQNMS